MPDSFVALERLGIRIPLETGFPFRGIRFLDTHSSVEADFPNGLATGVRRIVLHNLLLERVRELNVECLWGAKRLAVSGSNVTVDGRTIESDFLVAADGQDSLIRRLSGLHKVVHERRRFGFRRHYRLTPWSHHVEVYWGPKCQIYITPVANDEVCVVAMSRDSKLRLDEALLHFSHLQARLAPAQQVSRERGALSVSRKLRSVCNNRVALVGDASGSVDAITGEGLCLSFKQALSLAHALRSGDLNLYQQQHVAQSRRTHLMGKLMLTLDAGPGFQRRAIATLASHPAVFKSLLSVHVGVRPFSDLLSWQLVHFCRTFLIA